jgi:hypothetical protein
MDVPLLYRSKKMSTSSTSANQAPCSEGECSAPSEQILEPNPIEIEDDEEPEEEEEEDGPATGTKRKLTSVVWNEFKRVKYMGTTKAKCMYCFKKLSAETTHGSNCKIVNQQQIQLPTWSSYLHLVQELLVQGHLPCDSDQN